MILIRNILLASDIGYAESQSDPNSYDHYAKYEVAIKKNDVKEEMRYAWAGVILNSRYVLSVDAFQDEKE